MVTREQAQRLIEKVLKFSSFPECSVAVDDGEQAFIRFANNGVTTSGFTVERTLSVRATKDGKSGVSQTTDWSDEALRATVKRAEELAAIAPPNPERTPPLGPQKYAAQDNWDERTATARSPQLVPQVKAVLDAALAKKLVAAGFFNRTAAVEAFGNNSGNFGYQRRADARMTTTVRTSNGSSSGWAGQPSTRITEINGADLAARAIDKCVRWTKPAKLDPGRYTVVLEPTATADLVGLVGSAFSARLTEEGRSFFSKKGSGSPVGEKLFPEVITLRGDPFDKRFPTQVWTPEWTPNRPITWIEKGVVKNLWYDRYWAAKTEAEPTPAPTALILEGGSGTVADLVKATERGLLVTRFWYIRGVNPQTLQMTGLTRDGVFLIEKGEVTQPVMNFRFNESPMRLLQNVKLLGRSERVRGAEGIGMIAPALQVADFNFTSISDAV